VENREENTMSTEIHVVPIDDTFPHRADMTCCDAYIDADGLVIHHAHDKRECYERGGYIGGGGWGLQLEDNGRLIDLPNVRDHR
jgi:hypothetical protein